MSKADKTAAALPSVVVSDPERLGGEPVFAGTRVPVRHLFAYMRKGIGVEQFLDDFEGVLPEQVQAVLKEAEAEIVAKARAA